TVEVAALRMRVELARGHVVDHTLTQRTDGVGLAHEGSILSEVRNASILRTGLSVAPSLILSACYPASRLTPPSGAGAERLRALAHLSLSAYGSFLRVSARAW